MELPRMLHRGEARMVVSTMAECKAALAEGWTLKRRADAPVEVVAAPEADVSEPVKRRPGRPRKVVAE